MLQYLMEKYDKRVQTLEDRAMVANWVFFAYTSLVSSLLPGLQLSSCQLSAVAPDDRCAQQTTVSASMLLGVGVAQHCERATECAWSASPAAAARPGAPAQSPRPASPPAPHRPCLLPAPAPVRRGAWQPTCVARPRAGGSVVQQGQAGRAARGDAQGAGRQAGRPHLPLRRGRQRRGRGAGLAPALLQGLRAPGAAARPPPAACAAAARGAWMPGIWAL